VITTWVIKKSANFSQRIGKIAGNSDHNIGPLLCETYHLVDFHFRPVEPEPRVNRQADEQDAVDVAQTLFQSNERLELFFSQISVLNLIQSGNCLKPF
jgi:hypothetical protein